MTAPYETPVAVRPPQPGRARVALVLAIVIVALSIVGTVLAYLAPMIMANLDLPMSAYTVVFLPLQLVQLALAVTAIVLAAGPLAGSGPKGVAGAAVGISAAWAVTAIVGVVLPWVMSAVL